jgi:hypothetical protein
MNTYGGGIPGAKYIYGGWVLCALSIRYSLIPQLTEFVTNPLFETSLGSMTLFTVYTTIVLAVISSGSKGGLMRFAETSSRTTLTTLLAIGIIGLGLLTAGDILASEMLGVDPFMITSIIHFIHDPLGFEDLMRIGLNGTETLNTTLNL